MRFSAAQPVGLGDELLGEDPEQRGIHEAALQILKYRNAVPKLLVNDSQLRHAVTISWSGGFNRDTRLPVSGSFT
jgi:hypothetical protein